MASVPHDASIPWAAFEETCQDLVHAKLLHRAGRNHERQAALPHEIGTIRELYLRLHTREYPGCICGPQCWEQLMSVQLAEVLG